MNKKEREVLNKVLDGRMSADKGEGRRILQRPHVAINFEMILNEADLTDPQLAKKLHEIVNRKAKKRRKGNVILSNQSSIDSNTLQAIRTIWQVKGKFTEKHEVHHSGAIGQASDEYLDKLIDSGTAFLKNKKNRLDHSKESEN